MTKVVGKSQERVARRQVDKFAERRAQLAASALQTLSSVTANEVKHQLLNH